MKKIDLHVHTISTISDKPFIFSLPKIKEYVEKLEIDCIAITNHNLFNLEQFNQITDSLDIDVLPGIELDLEEGHVLLISENDELGDFSDKCQIVQNQIRTKEDFISAEKLREIFPNLNKYLLIPHYDKKPSIKPETLKKLNEFITAGEVSSIRKFKSCIKDAGSLIPVLFSDIRVQDDLESFPARQTFVDLDVISLRGLKSCLFDKTKVFLSMEEGNNFFQATDEGLILSTGMNVILGERSSGKTYTLNKISTSFDNVKYIKQFSLLQNDEERFKSLLSVRQSGVSESYLKEFKDIVEDVTKVDLKQNEIDFEKYLNSLLKFASESEKADTFSKSTLFGECTFIEKNLTSLKDLVKSVQLLLENSEYRSIIDKHIPVETLKVLAIDLMRQYSESEELNLKQRWLNNLISKIQDELRFRTTSTFVEDIDLYKIIMDDEKVKKFTKIVEELKVEKEINSKEIRGFKVVAYSKKYTGASQLKNKSKRMLSFSEAFNSYDNPYCFLVSLKNIELEETEYYRYFIDIEYKTLNKHGFPISGGERSEFNLLHEINDAIKHDMLLIDEPESSFDNIFLKNEVNELIKEIAKEIPVVLVTHNNTVGASIQPDYIAYTQKEIVDGEIKYKIFSGYPSNKQLKTKEGELIDNYNIMLNCLEAGKEAYFERRTKSYEILED